MSLPVRGLVLSGLPVPGPLCACALPAFQHGAAARQWRSCALRLQRPRGTHTEAREEPGDPRSPPTSPNLGTPTDCTQVSAATPRSWVPPALRITLHPPSSIYPIQGNSSAHLKVDQGRAAASDVCTRSSPPIPVGRSLPRVADIATLCLAAPGGIMPCPDLLRFIALHRDWVNGFALICRRGRG